MVRIEETVDVYRIILYTGRSGARRVLAVTLAIGDESIADVILDVKAEPTEEAIDAALEDAPRLSDAERQIIGPFLRYHAAQL